MRGQDAMKDDERENNFGATRAAGVPLDIEQMIIAEADSKQRAFLIVLSSINQSLIANTTTVKEISDKLETHLGNFETHVRNDAELLNRGKGAWRVMAWVLGIAQVGLVGLWVQIRSEFAQIDSTLKAGTADHAIFAARIKALEEKK